MAFTSYFLGKAVVSCSLSVLSWRLHFKRLSGALSWAHPTVVCMFCLLSQCAAIDSFSTLFDLVTQTVYVVQGFWIIKLSFCWQKHSGHVCVSIHLSICLSIHIHLYDTCMWLCHSPCFLIELHPDVIESNPSFCDCVCDSPLWVSMVTVDIHWWLCKSLFHWLWFYIKRAYEWVGRVAQLV